MSHGVIVFFCCAHNCAGVAYVLPRWLLCVRCTPIDSVKMELLTAFLYFLIGFIIYKCLDFIIRIPKLGGLDKRYILVTGCDTGFGHEIAKRLDGMGCHVFAACLTEKGESELQKSCSKRLKTLHMNVAKTDSIQKAYEVVEKELPMGNGMFSTVKLSIFFTVYHFIQLEHRYMVYCVVLSLLRYDVSCKFAHFRSMGSAEQRWYCWKYWTRRVAYACRLPAG